MKKKLICNLGFGLLIVILDQILKFFMINKNIKIINNVFNFTYTQNSGAAFGIGNNIVVSILTCILLIIFCIYIYKNRDTINNYIPYTSIIAGAISNFLDRLLRGYVIDFIDIDFLSFPCFNIADICIVVGVIILMWNIIKEIIIDKNKIKA